VNYVYTPELIWLNGEVMPWSEARIGVEDRGFQFADGVYEVARFYNGKPFTLGEHMQRLGNSAAGIRLTLPTPLERIGEEIVRFFARTGVRDGSVYLQLTRGVTPRNHRIPPPPYNHRTLLFYAKPLPPPTEPGAGEGIKLLAVNDERWKRCWIKCIGLTANVIAKSEAMDKGYDEAAFVENGVVSECSTANLFAVIGGKLITHPNGAKILPGITRLVTLDLATKLGIPTEERPVRVEECQRADELFITSVTREIAWVARWNDRYIGQAKCGPVTAKLHRAFRERVRAETA
jgi:D-alanine transaminase